MTHPPMPSVTHDAIESSCVESAIKVGVSESSLRVARSCAHNPRTALLSPPPPCSPRSFGFSCIRAPRHSASSRPSMAWASFLRAACSTLGWLPAATPTRVPTTTNHVGATSCQSTCHTTAVSPPVACGSPSSRRCSPTATTGRRGTMRAARTTSRTAPPCGSPAGMQSLIQAGCRTDG